MYKLHNLGIKYSCAHVILSCTYYVVYVYIYIYNWVHSENLIYNF